MRVFRYVRWGGVGGLAASTLAMLQGCTGEQFIALLLAIFLLGGRSTISVDPGDSIQDAINQAKSGYTILIKGSHDEDVSLGMDNLTIQGQDGATIDGYIVVTGNHVTIKDIAITGVLKTLPGSFENLAFSNVQMYGVVLNGALSCDVVVNGTLGETIQGAITAAAAGDFICAAPGTYGETVTFNDTAPDDLTLQGFTSGSRATITGGVLFDNDVDPIDGLALKNLVLKGDADPNVTNQAIVKMSNSAAVNDLSFNSCVFDGENVAVSSGDNGRHGLVGNKLGGSFSVTNSEFKSILGWALLDMDSSSDYSPIGGNGLPLTTITFSNNTVHDSNGSVALRGNHFTRTTRVDVIGNTWNNIGGVGGYTGAQWTALELNNAAQVNVRDNVISDVQGGIYGEGQCLQFWNVETLDARNNECSNTAQGIYFYSDGVGGTYCGAYGCPVPAGSISSNNIVTNGDFGMKVEAAAAGGPLDADNNWWGCAAGPGNPGCDSVVGNIDYTPWAISFIP